MIAVALASGNGRVTGVPPVPRDPGGFSWGRRGLTGARVMVDDGEMIGDPHSSLHFPLILAGQADCQHGERGKERGERCGFVCYPAAENVLFHYDFGSLVSCHLITAVTFIVGPRGC